jgi:hypothetical protein
MQRTAIQGSSDSDGLETGQFFSMTGRAYCGANMRVEGCASGPRAAKPPVDRSHAAASANVCALNAVD